MPPRIRLAAVFVAGALAPLAAIADSVYLKNGQSFEGVEAVVSGDTVQIELAIGRLRLPMSKVERIDEVNSTLGEYREREARLGHDTEDAEGWLELARWARTNDFDQGAEKAALVAARLDPDLPALESLMAGLGYELDAKAHQWIRYADAMRRKGLVEDRGEWVTPDQKRERSQAQVEAVADEPKSRTDDHLDKALDILAAAVSKPDAPVTTVVVQPGNLGYGFGFPGFVGGGFVGGVIDPGFIDPLAPGAIFRSDINQAWNAMAVRQPASFIPLSPNTAPRHIHPLTHRFTR
jgi:hypothetical protein